MTVRHFLAIVEIRTKLISLSTWALATVYVVSRGAEVRPFDSALLFVAVLALDMGTTAFNTFYDHARGVDHPLFVREPDKVLVYQGVAPGHALVISVGLFALAAVTGLGVAVRTTWIVLPMGVASMLVAYLYNGGPLPISGTPLGELFAGGFLGSVLFVTVVLIHEGAVDSAALVASLPGAFMIAGVLAVNNTCDREGDRAAGRRTLSVLLGRRGGSIMVGALITTATTLLVVLAAVSRSGVRRPWLPGLPAASVYPAAAGLALALVLLARMSRRGYSHDTKSAQMRAVLRIVLVYTAAYGAMFASGLI